MFLRLSIFVVIVCLFSISCIPQKEKQSSKTTEGKIVIQNARARSASEGMMSAAYLTIVNGTSETDTLTGVSTDIASKAEVHESFQQGNGMAGMRPAGKLFIKPGSQLELKPGGYHIMLIQLKQDVAEGDTIDLALNFAKTGSLKVKIPVTMNP